MERQKTKMSHIDGQKGLCDLRYDDQTESKNQKTNQERKEPRKLGPPDTSIHTRTDCTTVQLCGQSNVGEKWIHGHYGLGPKYQAEIGRIQETLHTWWKRRLRARWHRWMTLLQAAQPTGGPLGKSGTTGHVNEKAIKSAALWCDNQVIMSRSKMHLEQMMRS